MKSLKAGTKQPFQITVLGSGTSTGIPVPGCTCRVCLSSDYRNRRLRSSILISAGETNILIDTTPDFRFQALSAGLSHVDAVFWTHAHADHLHGLDDLRSFTRKKALPGYASEHTIGEIKTRFQYLWSSGQNGGGKAKINLFPVAPDESISAGFLQFTPVPILHGHLPIYGWRFGSAAYITDVSRIPEESCAQLKNLEVLIVGALREKKHPTHFNIEEALEALAKIRPKRAFLTHISHEVSHRKLKKLTPRNVFPARDGLRIRAGC